MRTTSSHLDTAQNVVTSPLARTPRVRDAQPLDPAMSLWQITTLSVAMVYASWDGRATPGDSR